MAAAVAADILRKCRLFMQNLLQGLFETQVSDLGQEPVKKDRLGGQKPLVKAWIPFTEMILEKRGGQNKVVPVQQDGEKCQFVGKVIG
jgi:hypothetical protein